MSSPLTVRAKWPSERQSQTGNATSDFVPYISNLINSFRKVPRPFAPKLVDPVTGQHISLDAQRQEINDTSRGADLATKDLDSQTGAAIRVANMGSRFRALNDLTGKETMINAQLGAQNNMLNANIDAQNTGITNAYHDDLVNAEMAQQRIGSENVANAADKYMEQSMVGKQNALEKEKAMILSRMYDPGVYSRLIGSLKAGGVDVSQFGTDGTPVNPFLKYKATTPYTPTTKDVDLNTTLSPSIMDSMKKYMKLRDVYAAGGMMKAYGGDPGRPRVYPVTQPSQFKGQNTVTGTNAFADNTYAMDHTANRVAHGIDMINNVVGSGVLPNQTDQDKHMRATLDPRMYSYLYQFNQRPDLKGMTPEQRIDAFYNVNTDNPDIQAMKDMMKNYGYGPQEFRRTQGLAASQPTVQRAAGGGIHIKPENRGKFTAYKKRTGKTTEEALHSKDPHVRQMANFARNARKWHHHHAMGGSMVKPFC